VPGARSQARTKKPTKAGKAAARAAAARQAKPKTTGKAGSSKATAKAKPAAPPKAAGRSARSAAAKAARTTARAKPSAPSRPAARPAPPKPLSTGAKAAARPAGAAGPIDRLQQVALVATDLGSAISFYSDVLGLPFIARFDPPGLAFFDLGGGVRLMLSATASSATLYLHVKDVDAAYKALSSRGVHFLHKPSLIHRDDEGHFGKKGSGEWMAFFKDPSENLLAIVERK
jgi:methylmalonyl-CoA/ethylmalonyl-CoA epimerase